MPPNSLTCPRCQGKMDPGFVLDRGHYNTTTEQNWVEGAPERSFWTGLKTKGRDHKTITTYRCERCGYLESYATNPTT